MCLNSEGENDKSQDFILKIYFTGRMIKGIIVFINVSYYYFQLILRLKYDILPMLILYLNKSQGGNLLDHDSTHRVLQYLAIKFLNSS